MSQVRVNTIVDANNGNTAQINGMTPTADSLQGFRNRIINGDMRIDQRNAGASVTQDTTVKYTLDRWWCFGSVTSKFTVQQNAGAVTPPAGFTNYLGATSSSAYTVGAGEIFQLAQRIEGFNFADLAWGTSSAQSVTVSFWVRSSLTGTFGGALRNEAANRSYPFSYTVSSANTWEQKTITIEGDTTGTWVTGNGIGCNVYFSMGTGSTFSGAAGAWSASNLQSVTGAVSVVGTSGATFYITGVQFEAGSVATPFERRDYGRELIMCQRYYQTRTGMTVQAYAATDFFSVLPFTYPVTMRANPTVVLTNGSVINLSSANTSAQSPSGFSIALGPVGTGMLQWGGSGTGAYTASIEL